MPRYLYGMRHLRGFGPGCQPARGLISREDDPAGRYNDVLVYDRALDPHEIDIYELDFMRVEPDTTTHESNVVKKGGNDSDGTSGDCISRQAVTKFLNDWLSCLFENCHKQSASDLKMIIKDFKNLPSAQPEHKTGHWIAITSRNNTYKCSVCGRLLVNITDGKNKVAKNYPYCHCGADMRGGENDGCSQVFEREESDV